MGSFRDRFFTPKTARALLSWRILLGAGLAVGAALLGVPVVAAVALGLVVYGGTVVAAMPKGKARVAAPDPFSISEPWRQFVQAALRSRRQLTDTVRTVRPGPLRDRLEGIAKRLEEGLEESYEIATRGDEIDAMVASLDPTRLRSRLDTLRARSATTPSEDLTSAVASLESQLASADRLKALSASTADRLRLTQARLDELVSRAAEVAVGSSDTTTYESDVDQLVLELEAVHLAMQELPQ